LLSCSEKTTKSKNTASVRLNLTHNYYADPYSKQIMFVSIEYMHGDPSLSYYGSTSENALVFPSVAYGNYTIIVTNPRFETYISVVNITSPKVSYDINLLVNGSLGGFVFYDKGYTSDGWRYMEAASSSLEFEAEWGAYDSVIGDTSTDIGSGKQNTQLIKDWLNIHGETGKAAQLCQDIHGKGEWLLPSRDELGLMFHNLHCEGLGDFDGSGVRYWSSSEISQTNTWWKQFKIGEGWESTAPKNLTLKVRPIRAF
ncbi:MAG: hypothetical protein FWG20_02010, partial [Candidatus Cloacimonetes bacterium]|nr:hypothetical protein [Candidatus Cloacimonadota bacterium]